MDVPCEFIDNKFGDGVFLLTCYIEDDLIAGFPVVTNQPGVMISRFCVVNKCSYEKVQAIWIEDCPKMYYLPQGLTIKFGNLVALMIKHSGLKEITRDDLSEFQKLRFLYIHNTDITSIPGDLLSDKQLIEEVSIIDNYMMKSISPHFLDPVKDRVKYVDLERNGKISAYYWPGNEGSTESIEQLMEIVQEQSKNPKEVKKQAKKKDGNGVPVNQFHLQVERKSQQYRTEPKVTKQNKFKRTRIEPKKTSSDLGLEDQSETQSDLEFEINEESSRKCENSTASKVLKKQVQKKDENVISANQRQLQDEPKTQQNCTTPKNIEQNKFETNEERSRKIRKLAESEEVGSSKTSKDWSSTAPDFFFKNETHLLEVHQDILKHYCSTLATKQGNGNVLIFKKFSVQAMEEFIRCIYDQDSPLSDLVFEVFQIATIMGYQDLITKCEHQILLTLDESNAKEIFLMGTLYNSQVLEKMSTNIIRLIHPDLIKCQSIEEKRKAVKKIIAQTAKQGDRGQI